MKLKIHNKRKSLDAQVLEAYQEGLESQKVMFYLQQNLMKLELSTIRMGPKAAIMAAYSYYSQDYYGDAIAELERFLRVYPNYKNLNYVYYLLGVTYYEQIVDEKKDLESISLAKKYFEIVITKYPNTEYAIDSRFKIDLINDILASKEMYIGRYFDKKWIQQSIDLGRWLMITIQLFISKKHCIDLLKFIIF